MNTTKEALVANLEKLVAIAKSGELSSCHVQFTQGSQPALAMNYITANGPADLTSPPLPPSPIVDAEGSAILATVFNVMTEKQKKNVSVEFAQRLGNFMVLNGYRMVFGRWYLQQLPGANTLT